MLELHHCRMIEWKPSPVVALATSVDGSVIAAARDSGAIEVWVVAPGAVGWHRQLVFPGKQEATISSLLWCKSSSSATGRLFSGSLDGFLTEWDLETLLPKGVTDSHGGSVWHLAAEPFHKSLQKEDGSLALRSNDDSDSESEGTSGSDDDDEADQELFTDQRVAVGCDDGCVRMFVVIDSENGMVYQRCFPRVKGRILSVAWSTDGGKVFAGGSDGCIHCWDVERTREIYRITAGVGGLGGGSDLCVWSLLVLRDGTVVSGDSSGSTQFWDGRLGTLLQAHRHHKADVLSLAAGPSHLEVFAAGADGQVSLYRLLKQSSRSSVGSDIAIRMGERWVFVGSKRAHTHDVRALAVAYPLIVEEGGQKEVEHRKKQRRQKQVQTGTDYQKWAVAGSPMLLSGGSDAKLFTYPANSFLNFHPHDICTAPENPFIQAVQISVPTEMMLIMSQHDNHVDLWRVGSNSTASSSMENGNGNGLGLFHTVLGRRKRDFSNGLLENGHAQANGNGIGNGLRHAKRVKAMSTKPNTLASKPNYSRAVSPQPEHLVRIKSSERGHIVCSAISHNGEFVAFSCLSKTRLFRLVKTSRDGTGMVWEVKKLTLPENLPAVHRLGFSTDSTRLLLAGPKSTILVVDISNAEVMHKFDSLSGSVDQVNSLTSSLITSSDSQWVAAVKSSGHISIYSLETLRHHWSIPPLDGACVAAAVFHPGSSNVLVVGTAANQLHVLDIEAKMLGDWSKKYGSQLPRQFLEFPGGLAGLSIPPSTNATSLIVYSPKAMCHVDFSKPVKGTSVVELGRRDCAPASNTLERADESENRAKVNGSGPLPHGNKSSDDKNFVIARFEEPVLFLGHISENSVLVVEKAWIEVLHQMPAPVFRHLYGT